MGIFNNEYRIVVGVSTQQLIKGKYTELRDTVLNAIFNNGNVAEDLLSNLVNGYRANVLKYHRIATAVMGGNNTLAPQIDQYRFSGSLDNNSFTGWIQKQIRPFFYDQNKMITLFNQFVADKIFNRYYWSNVKEWYAYVRDYYAPTIMQWNPTTKEVLAYPPAIDALGSVNKVTWAGISSAFEIYEAGYCEMYLTVHFTNGTTAEYTYYPLNYNGWMDRGKSLLVFEYQDAGVTKFIETPIYNLDPDLKSTIELAIYSNKIAAQLKYLPAVSIRKSFVNLVDEAPSLKKSEIIRALKSIGLELGSLTDSIMSTEEGNDPNIIDDAFVGFGVNVRSDNKLCIEYMFNFWDWVLASYGINQGKAFWDDFGSYTGGVANIYIDQVYKDLDLFGGDETNNYKHKLRFKWAEKRFISGFVGNVGDTFKSVVVRPNQEYGSIEVDDCSLILRRQLTATHYMEIEINGLQFVGQTYPGVFAYYYLSEIEDDGKNHIHFPIVIGLLEQFGTYEQGEILKEGLVLTIYAKDVVKIPWYLREGFLKAIQIVLIVVSIVTFNPQGATYAEILKQLALDAIKQIIIAKLLKIVIKELSDILGYDTTAILIAIAMIYGGYNFAKGGVPWADDLLKLTMLAQNSFNNIVMDELADTKAEMEEFKAKYDEAMEAVEKAMENFAPSIEHLISRRYMITFNPNETPEMFFNRTIHAGNVGVTSLNGINTYVDRMLRLPKNSDFEQV